MEKNWRQVKRKRSFSLICPRSGRGGGGGGEKFWLRRICCFLLLLFYLSLSLFYFFFFVFLYVFVFSFFVGSFVILFWCYLIRNEINITKKKKEKKCKKKTEKKQKRKSLLFLPSFVRLLLKVEICFACKCNY